ENRTGALRFHEKTTRFRPKRCQFVSDYEIAPSVELKPDRLLGNGPVERSGLFHAPFVRSVIVDCE
ncbi:MAG: hypothetical protein WBJ68_11385, partial [Candidatus Dechloromonas phosphoritropha]